MVAQLTVFHGKKNKQSLFNFSTHLIIEIQI